MKVITYVVAAVAVGMVLAYAITTFYWAAGGVR